MPINAAQKVAVEEVIKVLMSIQAPRGKRNLCAMFMELVDREEWPQYYEIIPEPRCINQIKAGLDKGRYKEASDVYTDLSLVFWNALFYNEPKSQIAVDAQTLKNALENEWKKKTVLGAPRKSPPPSSAQKVHGVVDQAEPESQSTTSRPSTTTSASTSTASSTAMAQPAAKPVPIRPKQRQHTPDVDVDIMSPDDGHGDDTVLERDPESEEIVKQLEKGLPRWPGFSEEGWMDDTPVERLLDLVHAVKNYKDVAGTRPSSSLEAVPEASTTPHLSYTTPLSLKIIESRARGKEYTSAKDFDIEVAKLFEKARRYYELCTEAYGHILLLQRLYQALTSPNPPSGPPYVSTQNFAALRAGPGTIKPVHGGDIDGVPNVTTHRVLTRERKFVDEVHYRGWTLKLADWVHLSNPDDPSRPIIAQVFRCWISEEPAKAGQAGITVSWYYRPEQTFHPAERRFWEGEVFKTSHFADHPVEDIIEKIACQFTARHIRGRPRPPYWYLGFPLYVCDSRYNDRDRVFVKIKNWNSCIPEEVRKSTEFMPIYPFERTVYPIRYPSPFLVKGNNSKVKGPGGIIPLSTSGDGVVEHEDVKKKNASGAGKTEGSGTSKGQQSAGNATAQGNAAAAASSVAPTPQPQHSQLMQQTQLPQHQPVQRPPGPDRSVFTAAGGTALGNNIQIEKLPPEITKHFDRDPDTNEMLWFSAPPMNVSRVPPAKHSLTYLHFLATKRKQGGRQDGGDGDGEQAMDEDDNDNDDDAGGGGDELSRPDMGLHKRVKLDNGVQPTTREMMQKLWVEMGMEW